MIRKLEIQDIDKVMDIWLETNINTHSFIKKRYWQNNFKDVKSEILEADVYVYEENEEIIGFVGLVGCYIAGIFVKENKQNNGIGKKLINKCKEKCKSLNLKVYEKNERAIKFYLKQGIYIENKKIDISTGEIELLMKWEK